MRHYTRILFRTIRTFYSCMGIQSFNSYCISAVRMAMAKRDIQHRKEAEETKIIIPTKVGIIILMISVSNNPSILLLAEFLYQSMAYNTVGVKTVELLKMLYCADHSALIKHAAVRGIYYLFFINVKFIYQ